MKTGRTLRHLVWEGRFQPIHVGHVAYVGELLARCDTLTVVVVANEVSVGRSSPVPEFSALVDVHHVAERNPWPLWRRFDLVRRTLSGQYPNAPLRVLAGHRLDLDWPLWDELLPPGRIFATPNRDEFEDAKADAWTRLGQLVERVEVGHLPAVSATLVRERIRAGGPLADILHPATLEMLVADGDLPDWAVPEQIESRM